MILVDSNVIIYHLNGMANATQFLIQHRGKMAISTISVSEILSFNASPEILKATENLLKENFIWIDISRDIIFKSAEIRRQKKTKTPDAIIGATALIHHLTIATRNVADFAHLPINIINPID